MATWWQKLIGRMAYKGLTLSYTPGYLKPALYDAFSTVTREAYGKNTAFFACVSALCFGAGEAPLIVGEKTSRPAPILDLMRRPNPLMGYTELMQITMAYLATGGNAYWHKVRNQRGVVIEVWPYPHGVILPKAGGPLWLEGYNFYKPNTGLSITLDRDDIVHFKWPLIDPHRPYQAMAPLVIAAAEVGTDNEATRYLHTLLVNDAMPRTIIRTNPERYLNPDEVQRTKDQFRAIYGGDGLGGVMVLEGGVDVTRLSLNLEELAFEAMHRIPEARICAVLRVPPIIAGVNVGLERSTFANYGEARRSFTQDTRVPLWNGISSEVAADQDLNPEGLPIYHDTSMVAALQEDQNALWQRVITAYQANLMEAATAQALLRLPIYTPLPSREESL